MSSQPQILSIAVAAILSCSGWAQVQQQPGYPQQPSMGNPNPNNSPSNPGAVPPLTTQDQQPADPLALDRQFAKNAIENSAAEVELGKIAQQNGSSDTAKQLGKRMVEVHSQTSEELKQAAAKANIQVASEPPRKARKAADKLNKLSGADFDRAFAREVMKLQKDDLKQYTRESKAGQSPDLKQCASRVMPALEENRKMAEQLENNAGGAAGVRK
jgi:putative membrane protein